MCTPKTYSQQYNVRKLQIIIYKYSRYIYIKNKIYNQIFIIFVQIFILVNLLVTEPKLVTKPLKVYEYLP